MEQSNGQTNQRMQAYNNTVIIDHKNKMCRDMPTRDYVSPNVQGTNSIMPLTFTTIRLRMHGSAHWSKSKFSILEKSKEIVELVNM